MEVPCFLQKEHGRNENNYCTKAIKHACLVQLTKQVPPWSQVILDCFSEASQG